MTQDFLINLVESCAIGAVAVSAISVTADRYGSKLAGMLAGFPSTVAAGLFFQARPPSGSIEGALEAATAVPLMMGVFAVLLAVYCAVLERGLWLAVGVSLVVWGLAAAAALGLGRLSFGASAVICFVLLSISFYIAEAVLKVPSSGGRKISLTVRQAAARCAAGAGVVGSSYVVGQLSGPYFGGMVSAFPAVTVSSLVVTYFAGGAVLSRALAKSVMLSGAVNVSAYAGAVMWLYPVLGVWWGTVAAFGVSLVSGFLTWWGVRRWMS